MRIVSYLALAAGMGTELHPEEITFEQIQSFRDSIEAGGPINMRDSTDTANLARALVNVETTTYTVKYPALKSRDLFPLRPGEGDDGATTFSYFMYDVAGFCDFVANSADVLPSVDIAGKEYTGNYYTLATSFYWTIEDQKRASRSTVDVLSAKPLAARQVAERKIDDVLALGDSTRNLVGILKHPNVTLVTPITGNFATATAAQILADISKLIRSVAIASKEAFVANTVRIPVGKFAILNLPRSDLSNGTILGFLKENYPDISFESWAKCDGAGAGAVDRMFAGQVDEMVGAASVPVEFQMLPPQPKGLTTITPCRARVGGFVCRYPVALAYMDGI